MAVKVANNRNRTARADEHRILAPHFVERLGGSLNVFVIHRNQAWVAGVDEPHFDIDASEAIFST